MTSLLRILKYALQDIFRNFSLFFMTVFTLVIMILSINILLSLDIVANKALEGVKRQIDVSFYFDQSATDEQVAEVEEYVSSMPQVIDVSVIDKEQVLASFKESNKNQEETLQALDELEENPFGPTMVVKADEPEDYDQIIAALDVPEYKAIIKDRSFDNHELAIQRLHEIAGRVEKISWALLGLFVLIAFTVIFNTVKASISGQRVEIAIKRLVGASNWFIRGPYLVETLVFTVVSLAAAFGLYFYILTWVDGYLAVIFSNTFYLKDYYREHLWVLLPIEFMAVFVLSVVSSGLAMRKQLKI